MNKNFNFNYMLSIQHEINDKLSLFKYFFLICDSIFNFKKFLFIIIYNNNYFDSLNYGKKNN